MTRNDTADATTPRIPLAKIGLLNSLAELGVEGVEDRLASVGDYDGDVRAVSVKTGYVGADRAPDDPDRAFAGVSVRLPGAPGGYVLVLFPPESANRAAAVMLDTADVAIEEADAEMAESALTELGGIMANGFADRWADAFDVEIDTRQPMFFNGPFENVLRRRSAFEETLGAYITARLALDPHGVSAHVYLFPDNETLVEILERLDRADLEGGTAP